MPSAVSQKWLAMHLKCPSTMMDLFTAAAIWLEKIHVQQLDIEKRQHFAWRFFQSGLQFQVSNLPKKGEQTQLFMENNLNRRFSNKKFKVLVLLLPVAIVSPYAAWKAWHPTFEPLASPPKIEFKSIEVPSSLLAFLACLCFVFLFSKFFVAVLISFGSFKFHLILSKSFEWSMQHGCQKSFDRFPDPPGEKSHAELCGRIQLLGCRKNFKELHGLNLAPIEPQVFIHTWMALLDALAFAMSPSISFHLSPKWLFPGFGGRIIFNVWAFISITCLPDLRDDCSLLAGSFSDVCVPSFLFICFHKMIFLLVSWPELRPTFVFWFLLFVSRCLLGWMPALPGSLSNVHTAILSLPHGFRCWMPWPDHFPASLSAFVYICLPHGVSCPVPFPHCVSSTASTTWQRNQNEKTWRSGCRCRCLTFHPVTFGSTKATAEFWLLIFCSEKWVSSLETDHETGNLPESVDFLDIQQ